MYEYLKCKNWQTYRLIFFKTISCFKGYKREEIENGFAVPPPLDENPEKQKGSDESTEASDGMAGEMFCRNEDSAHEDGDETLLEHILAQTAKFLKCNNKY